MPRLAPNQYPKLRLHRASGQALVTLSGRDCYCGPFGTPEAEAKYARLVAEWVAGGRRARPRAGPALTLGELAGRWDDWAQARYVKRGRPTSYALRVGRVADRVAALYGATPVADFGPAALKALRASWTEAGCNRTSANTYGQAVVGMVRWGVAEELVPADVLTRLAAVPGLSARDGIRAGRSVGPVPRPHLEAVVAVLRPPAATILALLACTGLRPGEACVVRPADLDRAGPVWWYAVASDWNKTEHAGRGRCVPLGPQARALLGPLVRAAPHPDTYLFRNRAKDGPYRRQSLWVLTQVGCRRAGVPPFHPNQIRHLYLSEVRAKYGLEAAQTVAGHSSLTTTQVYAEADRAAGARIAAEMG